MNFWRFRRFAKLTTFSFDDNDLLIFKLVSKTHSALNRLGSRFRVNETSQIAERYSVQIKASMKQKRLVMLGQMYLSIIRYPKHDWDSAFGNKKLCYSRAMAGTFILNLLYNWPIWVQNLLKEAQKCGLPASIRAYSKIFPCTTWMCACQKFAQYIHMLCPRLFILVESVY